MNFTIQNQRINSLVSFYDFLEKIKRGYVSFVIREKFFQPIIIKTDTGEVQSFINLKAEDCKFLFWIGEMSVKKDFLPHANVDEEIKNSIQKIFEGEVEFFPIHYFKF